MSRKITVAYCYMLQMDALKKLFDLLNYFRNLILLQFQFLFYRLENIRRVGKLKLNEIKNEPNNI